MAMPLAGLLRVVLAARGLAGGGVWVIGSVRSVVRRGRRFAEQKATLPPARLSL